MSRLKNQKLSLPNSRSERGSLQRNSADFLQTNQDTLSQNSQFDNKTVSEPLSQLDRNSGKATRIYRNPSNLSIASESKGNNNLMNTNVADTLLIDPLNANYSQQSVEGRLEGEATNQRKPKQLISHYVGDPNNGKLSRNNSKRAVSITAVLSKQQSNDSFHGQPNENQLQCLSLAPSPRRPQSPRSASTSGGLNSRELDDDSKQVVSKEPLLQCSSTRDSTRM